MQQWSRTLAGAGVVALLAGCIKVGPDFVPPQSTVQDRWMERDVAGASGAVSEREPELREWWRVFADPVLDRLVESATTQNLSLLSAAVQILQARAQLGIAVGNQYPQTQNVNAAVTWNRASERSAFATEGPASNFRYWQAQYAAQIAWEVDLWGQFRRGVESADAALLASIASYQDVLVSLMADVATGYVQVRTLEKRLTIAKDNVKVQEEALDIARIRFEGGTTTERDVEQALTVLGTTMATIPQLESALRQTKNALAVLLGLPPAAVDDYLTGPSAIPTAPTEIAAGIPADLLRRRPDIRAAELRAASQSAQIGVAKAQLYPALSLTGNFGFLASDWQNFNLSDVFLAKSGAVAVGPSVQWNVLNYGRITNNVRAQDAAFQALLADYQNTVLQAQREVEDGIVGFLNAQLRTRYLAEAARAAQRSLELAILQYREGIADFTTVLLAEQNLLQAQDALAVSSGDIPSNLIVTYRALGGGWDYRASAEYLPTEVRDAMAKRTNWGQLLEPAALDPSGLPRSGVVPSAPEW